MDDSRGGYVRCTMCETENEIDGQMIKDVYMSTKRAQIICVSCGAPIRVDLANATGGKHLFVGARHPPKSHCRDRAEQNGHRCARGRCFGGFIPFHPHCLPVLQGRHSIAAAAFGIAKNRSARVMREGSESGS